MANFWNPAQTLDQDNAVVDWKWKAAAATLQSCNKPHEFSFYDKEFPSFNKSFPALNKEVPSQNKEISSFNKDYQSYNKEYQSDNKQWQMNPGGKPKYENKARNMGDMKQRNPGEIKRNNLQRQSIGEQKHINLDQKQNTMQNQPNNSIDKRFKTLPPSEMLSRNEVLGGYIFVCNNDTMQEDLKRQLFGLPQRYRDSVRAIQPGLPLFLYNYTTHQLHGIFEASSFGGSNIDPTAWEDKKCRGESRFPAQVRTCIRKLCKPLEEDAFRPVLHHYDGPKFRLQLSVPETLALLDLFNEHGSV